MGKYVEARWHFFFFFVEISLAAFSYKIDGKAYGGRAFFFCRNVRQYLGNSDTKVIPFPTRKTSHNFMLRLTLFDTNCLGLVG